MALFNGRFEREISKMALNARQIMFAHEYVVDFNKTQAAVRAGYVEDCAHAQGYKVFKIPEVQELIDKLMEQRAIEREYLVDRVLEELSRIAFANSKDYYEWSNSSMILKDSDTLTAAQAAAISGIKAKVSVYGGSTEVKQYDKLKALELLGRHLAMWKDSIDLNKKDPMKIEHGISDSIKEKLEEIYAEIL
jgi:phage terminase small subunit